MKKFKYVVMENEGVEEIFIFPITIDHDCFEEVTSYIKNQMNGNWNRKRRKLLAAGFTDGEKCFGRSETLNIDSRGAIDEALLT